jgi:predicted Abi (CAAX) family protease
MPTDQRLLLRFALLLGASILLASAGPDVLFAATLASCTGLAALVTAIAAWIGGEPIWQARLTRWDVAAWLQAISLVSGLFVDPGTLESLLQVHSTAAP